MKLYFFCYRKGMDSMQKFSDITSLYKIANIHNDHFEIVIDKSKWCIYAFKIIPIVILNGKDKYILEILDKYEEFLRGLDLEFQIITINRKMSSKDYFNFNYNADDEVKEMLKNVYTQNLDRLLNGINIQNYEHYLIIKSVDVTFNAEKYMQDLEKIGLAVEHLNSNEKLRNLILEGGDLL